MKQIILACCLLFLGSRQNAHRLPLARVNSIEFGFTDSLMTLCQNQKTKKKYAIPNNYSNQQPNVINALQQPSNQIIVPRNIIIFGDDNEQSNKKYQSMQVMAEQTQCPYFFSSGSKILKSVDPSKTLDLLFRDTHREGPAILFLDKFCLIFKEEKLLNLLISLLQKNRKLLVIIACQNCDPNDLPHSLKKLCIPLKESTLELYARSLWQKTTQY